MKKIAQIVVGLPIEGPFDYRLTPEQCEKVREGSRVLVPFGNRQKVGYVVGLRQRSSFPKLKPVLSVLDNIPVLNQATLGLAREFSRYYDCSWGEAIETLLPAALRKKTPLEISPSEDTSSGATPNPELILCHDQGALRRWPFIAGKIKAVLEKGGGVVFLVPETHLIDRIQDILKKYLTVDFTVLDRHSGGKEELRRWISVREGQCGIVMGARSAVFAPHPRLGLMIVYDEEDTAYKQEQSPFYHVREVALMRHRLEGCPLLFVSSSPSAELWWQARRKRFSVVTLEAEGVAPLQVVDMGNYKRRKGPVVSVPLQNRITESLRNNGKTVLILNRRGFSTLTRCNECGLTLRCERCNVNLTYLYSKKKLVCRLCHAAVDLPKICPACQGSYLRSSGVGIEKMESELSRIFPQARVARFDRDTARIPREADIIVGTQAVVKIFDQVPVQTVGVLDFDAQLNRFDFRSAQRAFAGAIHLRQLAQEKVFIQTYSPYNYCLQAAVKADFTRFYKEELKLRKELELPPFSHLVAVGIRGPKEDVVFEQAKGIFEGLRALKTAGVEILDPQPDVPPQLRGKYRFVVFLKGRSVGNLLKPIKTVTAAVKKKKDIVITVNVDP